MPRLTGTQRMLEVAMILSSALAMFMLLSLLSFHQGDASWSQSGAYQEIQNAAGSIGAKCADLLFTWFGYTAYALPFLSAFVGWFLFQKKHHILELDYLNISLRLIGVVLMLIVTLFQIGGLNSPNEVIGVMFIFTIFAFCYNLGTTLKIFESFDGNDWPIKNAIRPLIPMVVILIRYFTL